MVRLRTLSVKKARVLVKRAILQGLDKRKECDLMRYKRGLAFDHKETINKNV